MTTASGAGLRIGITIGLHHEAETLWNNGIKQNAVFLAEALKHCPSVASVVLVNTTATQAPRASFQILLNDLFMCFELVADGRYGSIERATVVSGGRPLVDQSGATCASVYRNAGMYAVIYIPDAPH